MNLEYSSIKNEERKPENTEIYLKTNNFYTHEHQTLKNKIILYQQYYIVLAFKLAFWTALEYKC